MEAVCQTGAMRPDMMEAVGQTGAMSLPISGAGAARRTGGTGAARRTGAPWRLPGARRSARSFVMECLPLTAAIRTWPTPATRSVLHAASFRMASGGRSPT
eukprot:4485388-Prymnesium_polylepis.1